MPSLGYCHLNAALDAKANDVIEDFCCKTVERNDYRYDNSRVHTSHGSNFMNKVVY